MKRTTIVIALGAMLVAANAAAQAAPQRPATPPAPAPAAPPAAAPAAPQPQAAPAPVPFPADAKIAYVNMQFIVSTSKLGKTGQDRMKALQDKQTAERSSKNAELQTLQREIQTNASVWSAAVLNQKNLDLDRVNREAQFQEQQRQVDLENLNQQLLEEFSTKVLPLVEQLRTERGLWVVFSAGEGSNIAAVHPGLDISAEVVKRLDAGN